MMTCPFCNRDPFHYVDVGIGSVPVAVDCCELGDLYFRGARPELTDDVMLSADEFRDIGQRLSAAAYVDREADKVADKLLTMAARKSVTTQFGWTHPDCIALKEAARLLRHEPYPEPDTNPVGVLSTEQQ